MIVQVEVSPFILSSQDLFNGTFEQPTGIPLSIMLKLMVWDQRLRAKFLVKLGLKNRSHGYGETSVKEHGSSDSRSGASAGSYCHWHEITVVRNEVPLAFASSEATGFPPEIAGEVYSANFSSSTLVQAQPWRIALQGKDVAAIAETVSGSFLCCLQPNQDHPPSKEFHHEASC